jgi:hypothetical protein
MNKEQQELLDEAYENYLKGGHIKWLNQMEVNTPAGKMNIPVPYTQEEFINKCKTDSEFSEKWGLKIEERELSRDERIDLYCKEYTGGVKGKYEPPFDDFIDYKLTTRNIPTKLITITYNNKKIENYE